MQAFRTIVLGVAIVGMTGRLATAQTPAPPQTPPPATQGQQPPPKPTPTPIPHETGRITVRVTGADGRESEQVVREVLAPGPLGQATRGPLERYLVAQGFEPGCVPILYPIYLAAFLGEYGADRERHGILSTMKRLLAAALAYPPA